VLVVSWNCGGFLRSHDLITAHYSGLGPYLQRLGAAIFCVQETKVLPHVLRSAHEAQRRGAVLEGYRSFWAFNEVKGRLSGFNGVATWIREELITSCGGVRATQLVLGDNLDKEGRCLLVELGRLAVVNVYAPHVDAAESAKGEAQAGAAAKKLRFLELLRGRLRELRRAGRHVVLCGDLNLTWRGRDCAPGRRWLQVCGGAAAGRPEWPLAVEEGCWVRSAEAARALRVSCTAPAAHAVARLAALSGALRVTEAFRLGGKEVAAGRVLLSVNGARVSCPEAAREELARRPDAELEFGAREAELAAAGEPCHYAHERASVELLRGLLAPGAELVDTFERAHPRAEGRFTCWNQALNLRYSNCGARLDYVLCDAELAQRLVATPSAELPGASERHPGHTAEAALDAATSYGRWHEAPRKDLCAGEAGLSLQADNMLLNNSQFAAPHTGMLYTPPSYSDHVPACALFECEEGLFVHAPSLSEQETRRCTPWVAQPGLASFFGRGGRQHAAPS